jgi:hypothetical protein
MRKYSIYNILYGTGIIGILLGIPRLEYLPIIFYKHYLLVPTISFIIGLLGVFGSVFEKKRTIGFVHDDKYNKFKRQKIVLTIIIVISYLTIISICIYEFDLRSTKNKYEINHISPIK